MRLTVDEAIDRGLLGRVKVKVDGEYVKGVTVADEEQGYAECFKFKNGRVVVNETTMEAETEVIRGRVEIEIDGANDESSMS